jgi:hypothetical protein
MEKTVDKDKESNMKKSRGYVSTRALIFIVVLALIVFFFMS